MGVRDRQAWQDNRKAVARAVDGPREFRRLRSVPYTLTDIPQSPRPVRNTWKLVLVWFVIGLVVFGVARRIVPRPPSQPTQMERVWKERVLPSMQKDLRRA